MQDLNRVRTRWIAGLKESERMAQVLAMLVLGIAAAGLVGWVTRRWVIASLNPEYIPMAPSTALAFIALGCAILALTGWPGRRAVRRGAWVTALVVALVAGMILAHALLDIGPNLENWLYRNPELFQGVPVGRMSPLTALAFLLAGLALLTLLDGRPATCEAAVSLSIGVFVIGVVALVGYLYGAPLLYGGTVVPVALPTAAALTLLGLSLLATIGRQSRLLRVLAGPSVTARLLRAFIPAIALFALVHLWGDAVLAPGLGGHDPMLNAALVSLGATVVFGAATALITRQIGGALDQAEAGRQRAEAALRESEERYRTTLISIGDGVMATDTAGRVVLVNPVAETLTGWSQSAARGQPLAEVFQIVNEKTRRPVADPVARVFHEGMVVGLANHTLLIARDGTEHPIADSGAPIYNAQGELSGVVLVFRDQTAERAAAAALRESERRFRLLYEQSPVAYQSLDAAGHILEVNDAWLAALGYTRQEVVGRWFGDFLAGTGPDLFPQWFATFKARGEVHSVEWQMRRQDGTEIETWFEGRVGRDAAGEFRQTHCVFVNITERKRAAEALRASEERFRSLYENATIGIYRTTPDGQILMANPAAVRMLGFQSFDELAQRNLERTGYEPSYPRDQFRRQIEKDGLVIGLEAAWVKRDGTSIYVRESARAIRDEYGNILYYDGTFEDITERKQAEVALRESEERFRAVVESAPEAIFVQTQQRFAYLNPAAVALFGAAHAGQLLGRPVVDHFHPEYRAAVSERIRELNGGRRAVPRATEKILRCDGTAVDVEVSAAPFSYEGRQGALVFAKDITERKQAETALAAERSLLRTLVDHLPDAVYVKDAACRKTLANPADIRNMGAATEAEVLGKTDFDLFPQDLAATFYADDLSIIETGRPILNREEVITRPDGTRGWQLTSKVPLRNSAGQVVGLVGIGHDITERKRAEEALRVSETRFRELFDNISTGVAVYEAVEDGKDFVFKDFNRAGQQIEKIPKQKVLNRSVTAIFPGIQDMGLLEVFQRVWRTGQPEHHPATIYRDERIIGWRENYVYRLPSGEVVAAYDDITERKRAAELVAQQRDLLNGLFENIPLGIAVLSPSGDILHVNRGYTSITGYTLEDTPSVAEGLLRVFPNPAYRQIVLTSWQEAFEREEAIATQEYRIVARDGSIKDIEFRGVRLSDGRVLVSLIDVSERRRSEEALRTSEARLQIAKAAAGLGIYDHDVASGTLQWDQRVRELWGVGPIEPITYDVFMAGLHPDDRAATQAARDRALDPAGAGRYYAEYRVIALSDRSERWVAATGQAFFEEGRAVRLVGTVQDIAERKQAEDQLRRMVMELQRSNADLERFAYVASHDLQEPLRMVASYVQLLSMRYRGRLDADADEFIDYAVEGAQRMQQLILDLLEYSRVGARGKLLEPTDAAMALADALGDLKLAIADAGTTVTCDPLPTVMADATQLTQLFQNLIGNAIKFRGADPPQVHISAQREANHWQFRVCDNGIGIDPQYFDRIFVIFQRLHTREAYPGTGVGLAICRRIIERHGGRIWVESAPGKGATFYFTLPA